MMRLLACDDRAPLWLEPANEAYLSFRSASLVPRQPEAIRSTHVTLAHVNRHLIGRKNISPCRFVVRRLAIRLIECIDHQLAFDQNRLLSLFVVEHESPAESALRLLPGLTHHGIGPRANDSHRNALLRLVFIAERPGVIEPEHLRHRPGLRGAGARGECENDCEG